MKYFANCKTLEELKKEYRRLAMIHHPDRGGSVDAMKEINVEYEKMHNILSGDSAEEKAKAGTASEYIRVIDALMKLEGLEIELCGSWLWIGGRTYEHKDALKQAACRWSNNKKKWYWRPAEQAQNFRRGKPATMGHIRDKYGSKVLSKAEDDLQAVPA